MNVPEINVHDLSEMLRSNADFIILDVREPWELDRAKWSDDRLLLAPLSQLSQHGMEPLPKDLPVIVVCHHGIRSAQITHWLSSQGMEKVFSLHGGIEAYALQIDPSVGRY